MLCVNQVVMKKQSLLVALRGSSSCLANVRMGVQIPQNSCECQVQLCIKVTNYSPYQKTRDGSTYGKSIIENYHIYKIEVGTFNHLKICVEKTCNEAQHPLIIKQNITKQGCVSSQHKPGLTANIVFSYDNQLSRKDQVQG